MKISTKGTYALRIMADIAKNGGKGLVSNSVLAQNNNISEKYLEQIIGKLVKSKLLLSFRGSGGGYKLAKLASEISVGEILRATEGNFKTVSCIDNNVNCDMIDKCLTVNVWVKLDKVVNDFLNSVTLEDVVQKNIK